jgi:hypothetical protein
MANLRPITVITGASSGIGAALARVFARHGHALALVARRADRLQTLADELATTGAGKPLVIAAHLQRDDAVRQIGDALAAHGAEPQYIINNAGFGLVGAAASLGREEQLQMIDLNMRSLTALSLAFVDSLARQRGGILNVGSMAGFLPIRLLVAQRDLDPVNLALDEILLVIGALRAAEDRRSCMLVHRLRQRIAEARAADVERIAELGQHLADPAGRGMFLVQDEKDRLQHGGSARFNALPSTTRFAGVCNIRDGRRAMPLARPCAGFAGSRPPRAADGGG